jgi:hypothetical protein
MTEKEQWDAAQAYQMTGGPAFPVMLPEAKIVYTGMTIRDWFAGMALQGLSRDIEDEVKAARWCYGMADAMLKERLK